MVIKLSFVPQKDNRYGYSDCVHLDLDTEKKTYAFYEDAYPRNSVAIKRKSDLMELLEQIKADGYEEVSL